MGLQAVLKVSVRVSSSSWPSMVLNSHGSTCLACFSVRLAASLQLTLQDSRGFGESISGVLVIRANHKQIETIPCYPVIPNPHNAPASLKVSLFKQRGVVSRNNIFLSISIKSIQVCTSRIDIHDPWPCDFGLEITCQLLQAPRASILVSCYLTISAQVSTEPTA
jgi:hypothetical protein